jgi:hypothetical protein
MNQPIGHKRWAIAEGYIPGWSHGPEPQMESHETLCVLNTRATEDAHLEVFIFYDGPRPGRARTAWRCRPGARRHVRFQRS